METIELNRFRHHFKSLLPKLSGRLLKGFFWGGAYEQMWHQKDPDSMTDGGLERNRLGAGEKLRERFNK